MLRLTGRKGDGWLPSLSYLNDGDLERGNATIDEAATAAGRDPREIRRLLNVGLGNDEVLTGCRDSGSRTSSRSRSSTASARSSSPRMTRV